MKKMILASIFAATACFTMTTQANAGWASTQQHHDQTIQKKKQGQHKIAQKKATAYKAMLKHTVHKTKAQRQAKHKQQLHKKINERR